MPVEQMAWTKYQSKYYIPETSLDNSFPNSIFQGSLSVKLCFSHLPQEKKEHVDKNSLKRTSTMPPLLFVWWISLWSSHLGHVTVRHHTNFWPSPKEPVAPWSIGAMELQPRPRDPHLPFWGRWGFFFGLVGWFGKGVYFQLLTGKIYVECKL